MDRKVKDVEATPKTEKAPKEKKPFSKKQKIILICVISLVVALLVAGGVVLGLYLSNENQPTQPDQASFSYVEFEYYVDYRDVTGFKINDTFLGTLSASDVTVHAEIASEGITLKEDLTLAVTKDATFESYAEYDFIYDTKKIAKVKVYVVEADGYVQNANELFAINGTNKTYVVRTPIDLTGKAYNVEKFFGTIHFNHNSVKGFDASRGGLFQKLEGATVTGLNMLSVNGNVVVNASSNFGVIADVANNSTLKNSSVSGEVTVTSTAKSDASVFVGGMLGYVSAVKRSDYLKQEPALSNLRSKLKLTVSGSGDFKVGGIAGAVSNASCEFLTQYGAVSLTVSDVEAPSLGNVCLGGVIGAFTKEYTSSYSATAFDSSNGLYAYCDVTLKVSGGSSHNMLNVGGSVGYLKNHSLANVFYDGTLDVDLTRCYLKLGGAVGNATNELGLSMLVKGVKVKGKIEVYSLSGVYAGGVIGEADGVAVAVTEAVLPLISTDSAKVQGVQTAHQSIAKIIN